MSLLKKELTDKNQYTLELSIDHDTFENAINRVFKKQAGKFNIPGFRKGKAPRSIIEKMYGKGFFYEDAINDLLPTVYEEALKESELDVVGKPEFDIKNIDDTGVVLTAKVFVKPDVEIENYMGIKVTKKVEPVTDEELDNEINTVRERNSRETEVEDADTAAAMGDITVIDFDGSVDGVAFDGGKGENYTLKLGSHSFIPGFEDQIVGKKINEEFDVNVTFPEDYHAKELAGKAAVFKCKLNKLTKVELPALDDDFAKDVSEFDTFDEYKADLKAKIEKRHESVADRDVDEQLSTALIEKLVADIPECMFVEETENFVRDYDNRLRMQGLDLNTYLKYTNMTLDNMREQMRPQAEQQVKLRLALEKIAALENIEATEEDINGEYENIAKAYNVKIEEVKASIDSSAIAADMKVKKAMDLVKANAKISKPRKPAAKKTAAANDAETESDTPAQTNE